MQAFFLSKHSEIDNEFQLLLHGERMSSDFGDATELSGVGIRKADPCFLLLFSTGSSFSKPIISYFMIFGSCVMAD